MGENTDLISSYDMGFLYGFSLFETILVDENRGVFLLDKHMTRLFNSLEVLKFVVGFDKLSLTKEIKNYIKSSCVQNKILRITISYGNPSKALSSSVVITERQNTYTEEVYARGYRITVSNTKKCASSPLLHYKTANYLENFLILKEANQQGFDDAMFLNTDQHITETTKSNLFFVKDEILYTPQVECGLLPGILRDWVIERANKLGIICIEGKFDLDFLRSVDEVFSTNSVMGIMPVLSINQRILNIDNYRLTRFLTDAYKQERSIYNQ